MVMELVVPHVIFYAYTPVVKAAFGFSGLACCVGLTTAGSAVFMSCLTGALY